MLRFKLELLNQVFALFAADKDRNPIYYSSGGQIADCILVLGLTCRMLYAELPRGMLVQEGFEYLLGLGTAGNAGR